MTRMPKGHQATAGWRNQRGISLAEVLVAFTILAVTITTALVLYDDTRRALARGENMIDQQQVVRIAFDMISSDLRMAGYNVDPDGTPGRPDEPIEGAFDTAIVLRADFDADGDGSGPTVPESSLAGGAFDVVSTGNDEIVAYVLSRPDGSGPDTLTFEADVQSTPRDGTVDTVSIDNVALVHDNPPYTLYRVTLDAAGSPVRMPLAENVLALRFRYFDSSGQVMHPFDIADTSDDIGGADDATGRALREAIRRVEIDVLGQTRDIDQNFRLSSRDAAEIASTSAGLGDRRRFRLRGDVLPENIGLRGIPDLFATASPPPTPASPTGITGHCGGLWVNWTANAAIDDVHYYRLFWGTTPGQLWQQYAASSPGVYLDGLSDAQEYYLSVQAVSHQGVPSPLSSETSITTAEATRPSPPPTTVASVNAGEQIVVDWTEVTTNADPVDGDPQSPSIRELAGYRLYRSDDGTIDASDFVGSFAVDEFQHIDDEIIHCQDYHYGVRAEDRCGTVGDLGPVAVGRSFTTTLPIAPPNVEVFYMPGDQVRVSWQRVIENEDLEPVSVDRYRIYRTGLMDTALPPTPLDFTQVAEVTVGPSDPLQYVESLVVPVDKTVYYQVTAVDRCPNESVRSAAVPPACYSVADFWIEQPEHLEEVATSTKLIVRATAFTGPHERVLVEFENLSSGAVYEFDLGPDSVFPPSNYWTFNDWSWVEEIAPHDIQATLVQSQNCTITRTIRVFPKGGGGGDDDD